MIDKTNIKIDFFTNAPLVFSKKRSCLIYGCDQADVDGEVIEFGVFKGKSLRIISDKFANQKVYGFDSFEGLPEDWIVNRSDIQLKRHPKGHFKVATVPDFPKNVEIVKGVFKDSLPKWIKTSNIKKIKLIHIDSDLYTSAKTVLTFLNSYIVAGSIIVFDEMYPWSSKEYEFWYQHEWKALTEWVYEYNRKLDVICRSKHQQCSIRIIV